MEDGLKMVSKSSGKLDVFLGGKVVAKDVVFEEYLIILRKYLSKNKGKLL